MEKRHFEDDREKIDKFRSDLNEENAIMINSLNTIKSVLAKNGSYRMKNLAIIYNNSMSFVLHRYYKYDISFFDSVLGTYISYYLYDYYVAGLMIFEKIMDYVDDNTYKNKAISPDDKYINSLIDAYVDITDKMYSFDIDKDIPLCLENFYNRARICNIEIEVEDMLEDIHDSCGELEIDDSNMLEKVKKVIDKNQLKRKTFRNVLGGRSIA